MQFVEIKAGLNTFGRGCVSRIGAILPDQRDVLLSDSRGDKQNFEYFVCTNKFPNPITTIEFEDIVPRIETIEADKANEATKRPDST